MPRSSDRGQIEPLAALSAVVAVCLALSLYVGVLDASLPDDADPAVATTTLDRVERTVGTDGVALPSRLDEGRAAGPAGYHTNVTLTTENGQWAVGPVPNASADVATTRIGVRVAPAAVRTGRLRVAVWP